MRGTKKNKQSPRQIFASARKRRHRQALQAQADAEGISMNELHRRIEAERQRIIKENKEELIRNAAALRRQYSWQP